MTVETIVVDVGSEFTIRLTSTPTTGYVWNVQALPEGIQLLGSAYEKSPIGIRPGDPIIHAFRFRALLSGQRIINFFLKRQWESNAIEAHTVTVQAN